MADRAGCSCPVAHEIVVGQLDHFQVLLSIGILYPSIGLILWIDHQWPSVGILNCHSVVHREGILGQTVDVPRLQGRMNGGHYERDRTLTWILIGSPSVSAREYFSASEHGNFFFLHRSIHALDGTDVLVSLCRRRGASIFYLLRCFLSKGTGECAEVPDHTR